MAFTSIVALTTAEVTTAAMVLGAMAEVGTVLTVVGAVTGDKNLTKIGGTMALVGGVGGMIAGAGAAAGAAEAGNLAQQGFRAGEITAQNAAAGVADVAIDAGAAGMAAPEVANFAATPGIAEVAPLPQTAESAFQVAQLPDVAGPAATQVAGPADVAKQFETGASEKGDSFFSGVFNFIKDPKNKELVNTGAKVIGGALEGASKADEFDRTQGLKEDEFAFKKQQSANVNQQNQSRSGIIQRVRA
jgi:hypothetical protein